MPQTTPLPHRSVRTLFRERDPDHPLWQVTRPPDRLHVQGHPDALALLERLPRRGLAIVGTREPQPRSARLVRESVALLAGADAIILSGLARGIDTEAHLAALDVGLPTIAVLGTGLDTTYPPENRGLRDRILESGGLVITEFDAGGKPLPDRFLRRNRLIAGWSDAVWVAEAPCRSGALSTAKEARELHRLVFATPGFPGDPSLQGNEILLDRDHALAFWGAHSLGAQWIEYSLLGPSAGRRYRREDRRRLTKDGSTLLHPWDLVDSDTALLCREAHRHSTLHGGATVDSLLVWANERGWEPSRFYFALQRSLADNWLSDEAGIVTTL